MSVIGLRCMGMSEFYGPGDDQESIATIVGRFQGANFEKNLELVRRVEEVAREKKCTSSQLALAWVLAQGEDIVPIPVTKRRKYIEENAAAVELKLSAEDLQRIDEVFPKAAAAGARYPEALVKMVGR